MFPGLKNHPFPVEAYFKNSLVLTFAIPKNDAIPLIPEKLELDCLHDEWAFIAVAMVQTEALRPKGFPKFFGRDFFLIGYRVFVRYTTIEGKRLRGLYILKSETDKKAMQILGNFFTHYNYSTTDIAFAEQNGIIEVRSKNSGIHIKIQTKDEKIELPRDSPFADWHEARKFAGPLPFTFNLNKEENKIVIIEGVRENWKPSPVEVIECKISFIDELKIPRIRLANAFIIRNIPYLWKKGRVEKWKN